MANLAPQFTDKKWGRDYQSRFDYLQHPTRDPGGNPVIFWRHGGAGIAGQKSDIWTIANGLGDNAFATYLTQVRTAPTDVHFDVCSMEFAQCLLGSTDARSKTSYFPEAIVDCQRAVAGCKEQIGLLGGDPGRIVGMGISHGAWQMVMANCLMAPSVNIAGGKLENRRVYETRAYDSKLRGLILHSTSPVDLRRQLVPNTAPGFGSFVGATWTQGSLKITKVAAFTNYDSVAGDQCVISAGTNATLATYNIASKIDNDNITLTTSVGATASNLSGYTNCESIYPTHNRAYFGTLQRTGNLTEWYNVPAYLKPAVSALAYVQAGSLSFYVPTIQIYETVGTGNLPYGNITEAGSDVHDIKQMTDFQSALRGQGLASQAITVTLGQAWDDSAPSQANYSAPLYAFAVQCITS